LLDINFFKNKNENKKATQRVEEKEGIVKRKRNEEVQWVECEK